MTSELNYCIFAKGNRSLFPIPITGTDRHLFLIRPSSYKELKEFKEFKEFKELKDIKEIKETLFKIFNLFNILTILTLFFPCTLKIILNY